MSGHREELTSSRIMERERTLRSFIGGRWVESSSGERLSIVDPATEEPLGTQPRGSSEDVDCAVSSARAAFEAGCWRRLDWRERARVLRRAAELIRIRADELARIETLDQGRPLRQSREMSVPKAAAAFDFFAGALTAHTGMAANIPGTTALTLKQPIGVVGCITPGNVPLVLAGEKLAPALAAGNSVVLKPPEECPLSSALLFECLAEAGLPEGVVNLVLGSGDTVGRAMAEHPEIAMIAFTGSTATGREIMRLAAGNVKRLLLELGGKAPFVVCEDADLDAALEGAMWGAYANSGQVCMAATRFLVHEAVFDAFAEKFVARTGNLVVGPGLDETSEVGPMMSARARDRIEDYVAGAISAGARLLCGGGRLRKGRFARGFWVQPAVFTDVPAGEALARDEVFGPVVVLQRFATLDEAIVLANDTPYGLAGSVWTSNVNTALALAEEVRAGYVWINDHLVRAPGFPFGGWQQSGFGREASLQTLDEFSHVKTVHLSHGEGTRKPHYQLLYADPPAKHR